MDPVTHTLVGASLGRGLFRKSLGEQAVPLLCLASNLPDLDVLVHFTSDPAAITLRRSFGHSVFAVPLWSLLLAWLFRKRWPQHSFLLVFGACLAGASLHVFFDLINSFGVLLLWPFSGWRPELGIVFILDLILTGILAAPWVFSRGEGRLKACRLALACAAGYLAFCGANRLLALRALDRSLAGTRPEFRYVFPEPLGPHRWRGVARQGGTYRVSLIHSLTGTVEPREEVPTDLGDPAVEAARASPLGRRLDAFFKAPVWRKGPGGAVTARDLRFSSLVVRRGGSFSFEVAP